MLIHNLKSVFALLVGILMIMMGFAYQSTILNLYGLESGFSGFELGLIGSINFIGFIFGSIVIPKYVNSVGHVRTFAAMSAIFSVSTLLFPIGVNIFIWGVLQWIIGFTSAALFLVAESWLNDSSDNNNRAQLLSLYVISVMIGKVIGYNFVSLGEMQSYMPFTIISISISLSVVPMLLSAGSNPVISTPESLSFKELYKISPAGVTSVFINSIVVGLVNGYAAVYAKNIALSDSQVGIFLSLIMLGTIILQYPLGKISDLVDRRWVIFATTSLNAIMSIILIFYTQVGILFWIFVVLFGGSAFSIYSLAIAHSNDLLKPSQRVAASASLIIISSVGMSIGPFIGGLFSDLLGPASFFAIPTICALTLNGFLLYRMTKRQAPADEQSGDFVAYHARASVMAVHLDPSAPDYEETLEADENYQPDNS